MLLSSETSNFCTGLGLLFDVESNLLSLENFDGLRFTMTSGDLGCVKSGACSSISRGSVGSVASDDST